MHETIHAKLVESNARYKANADCNWHNLEFTVGDFVWAILTKDRYPSHEYNKLVARKIGQVEIVEKINPNAYRLKLPSHIRSSHVFNVKHLVPYAGDNEEFEMEAYNSRSNYVPVGENDVVGLLLAFMDNYDHILLPKI